jgi:hypothetical protein
MLGEWLIHIRQGCTWPSGPRFSTCTRALVDRCKRPVTQPAVADVYIATWCLLLYACIMPRTSIYLYIYVYVCMFCLYIHIYIHVYVYIVIIIYSQACACLNYVHTQYIYNYILIPKTLLNDSTKPSWNDLTCLPSSPDSLSRSIFWQCCMIQNLQMTTSAQFQHCVKALHLGFTD